MPADVRETLAKLNKEAQQNHKRAVKNMTDTLDRKVNVKTGKLARSQRVAFQSTSNSFTAIVNYPDYPTQHGLVDVPVITDKGHRKRIIRPTHSDVLAFKVGGKMVFAKSVKGYKGSKWWSKTMQQKTWTEALRRQFS